MLTTQHLQKLTHEKSPGVSPIERFKDVSLIIAIVLLMRGTSEYFCQYALRSFRHLLPVNVKSLGFTTLSQLSHVLAILFRIEACAVAGFRLGVMYIGLVEKKRDCVFCHSKANVFLLFSVLAFAASCSQQSGSQLKKIIGSNDMVKLKSADQIPIYADFVNALGQMQPSQCSATHLGSGVIVTAGHCVGAAEEPSRNISCSGITIDWGVLPHLKSGTSQCLKIAIMEDSQARDYAVLIVDNPPIASLMPARTSVVDRSVSLFGYPHASTLTWSGGCTLRSASLMGRMEASQFLHDCDSVPGESGGAIVDDETHQIVGIHNGGKLPFNFGTFIFAIEVLDSIGIERGT